MEKSHCYPYLPIFGHQAQVGRGRAQQLRSQKGDNGPCHNQAVSVQENTLQVYAFPHPPRKHCDEQQT